MSGHGPHAPRPVQAEAVPAVTRRSLYPPPFDAQVAGRIRRRLGEHFGLRNFGVNYTRLEPGSKSALLHRHTRQDEFIFVLEGEPTLIVGDDEHPLQAGDCYGFPAGGAAHQLVNRTAAPALFLEIGDRTPDDDVVYPDDDLALDRQPDGSYIARHKDGRPY